MTSNHYHLEETPSKGAFKKDLKGDLLSSSGQDQVQDRSGPGLFQFTDKIKFLTLKSDNLLSLNFKFCFKTCFIGVHETLRQVEERLPMLHENCQNIEINISFM